jgi:uncharacterized protein involved in cysteine biosynthesis
MLLPASSYPIQGIIYFLLHPVLWVKCLCAFIVIAIVGIASLAGSFVAMPSIAHALIDVDCPSGLAWVVAVLAALLISALIIVIATLIILPIFTETIVDYVWKDKGLPVREDLDTCCRGCSTDCQLCCSGIILSIVVLIITLPLNAIPIIGTIIFCAINGWLYAWEKQTRYHVEVKGWDFSRSRAYAVHHWYTYTVFGVVCYLLLLVPLANILFGFTNAVGAALWAAAQWNEEQKILAQTSGADQPSNYQSTAQMTALGDAVGESSEYGPVDVLEIQQQQRPREEDIWRQSA